MKTSRAGVLISALPSLLMVGLFYSLALHMRFSLGAWPTSIGTNGFSHSLSTHAELTYDFCIALFRVSLFMLPPAIAVCLLLARWRRIAVYLGLHAVFFVLCWGLMLLAPAPFLYWWWD